MNERELAGIEKGLTEGRNVEKLELAKKMLEKNISIDDISEITDLTKEEIDNIKN